MFDSRKRKSAVWFIKIGQDMAQGQSSAAGAGKFDVWSIPDPA